MNRLLVWRSLLRIRRREVSYHAGRPRPAAPATQMPPHPPPYFTVSMILFYAIKAINKLNSQVSPGLAIFALFGGLAGSTLYFLAIGANKEKERKMNRIVYGLEGYVNMIYLLGMHFISNNCL